jgi:hypothetical protein
LKVAAKKFHRVITEYLEYENEKGETVFGKVIVSCPKCNISKKITVASYDSIFGHPKTGYQRNASLTKLSMWLHSNCCAPN